LKGVWVSNDAVFAVGGSVTWVDNPLNPCEQWQQQCTVLRFADGVWEQMATGTTWPLKSVWGTSSGDVYAVGGDQAWSSCYYSWPLTDGGSLLHFDGATWEQVDTGTYNSLNSVWGTSASDVYALGNWVSMGWDCSGRNLFPAGLLLHYDGQAWNPVSSGGSYWGMNSLWGSPSLDLFAVGWGGTIMRSSALPPPPAPTPPRTLNISVGEPYFFEAGDSRSFALDPGDQVTQFTQADLTVGDNATGSFFISGRHGHAVSGDLSGTLVVTEENGVQATWDGLTVNRGYLVNKFTFSDGWGNNFEGVMAADLHLTTPYPTLSGYAFSTSGTGVFSDGRLIGTVSATSDSPGVSMSLRWYSSAEVSGPQALSSTDEVPVGAMADMSAGMAAEETILQFAGEGITIPGDQYTFYNSGMVFSGPVTGDFSGKFGSSMNGIMSFSGFDPVYGYPLDGCGWAVGTFTYIGASGTMKGVMVMDTPTNGSPSGYVFATMDGTTGDYAGKDYFGEGAVEIDPETSLATCSADLHTLTPRGWRCHLRQSHHQLRHEPSTWTWVSHSSPRMAISGSSVCRRVLKSSSSPRLT